MSLVTRNSLPVLLDTPTPRATVACAPYRTKLSLEACAKRSKSANSARPGNMASDSLLAVSACRNCQVGITNRHIMERHGLSVKTRAHYSGRSQKIEDSVL